MPLKNVLIFVENVFTHSVIHLRHHIIAKLCSASAKYYTMYIIEIVLSVFYVLIYTGSSITRVARQLPGSPGSTFIPPVSLVDIII